MALVKKDVNAPSCKMLGDYLTDSRKLLVADNHETWISSQLCRYLVRLAKAGEGLPEFGHTLGELLIPGGEGVLGCDDEEPVAGFGSESKSGEGFGRLACAGHREGRPGWQCSEKADISYLLRGERSHEA